MFRIVEKRELAQDIFQLVIEAPRVARSAKPGQFVIVRSDERGERIPLTISDYDAQQGTVSIVVQAIGVSTKKICSLAHGEALADFAGPLGRPSDFVHEDLEELKKKKFLFVAGGVGTAPVYPQVKWLHDRAIAADVIVGAKNSAMHIMTEEMRSVAGNLYLTTDDGSLGYHGLVTGRLKELVDGGNRYDEVIAIGPMIMMKFVALTTKEYGLKTVVSLNTLMVDGTGMCGACRVTVGGKTLFTCVDGPEFDGHQIDFDEAMRRQGMYRTLEERARKIAEERAAGHKCNIGLDR
ncbi:MAG: sulfide/dihydroorotate dehydrogenase-like FAD/NAD-binding protein [Rikenellaceae bacterium]|nr:sulfide/dihydroorotate dehydrogenase-like FAD/NAD-binding protein [Rikenellaceae bacterium]